MHLLNLLTVIVTIAHASPVLDPLYETPDDMDQVNSGQRSDWMGSPKKDPLTAKIENLVKKVRDSQSKKSTDYAPDFVFPPVIWKQQKGIFESAVHLNFKGSALNAKIRKMLRFPDDNGFVTSNVLESLLAARKLGVQFDKNLFKDAMDAIISHQDKNSPASLPIFNFWNQYPIHHGNVSGFQATPSNIVIPLNLFGNLGGVIEKAADKLDIQGDLRQVIDTAEEFSKMGSSMFIIPPDADDTGCALAVSAQLKSMAQDFPDLANASTAYFEIVNDPNGEALDAFVKYAYRPLSKSVDHNVIDSRTYRWLRPFLQQKVSEGATEISLITTWFQRISDIAAEKSYQKMPFNVNNVDASVVVNGLYGMLSLLASDPAKYASKFTDNHVQLFDDSVSLIAYILDNNLIATHAPSILLYYPSRFAFYYFVSRFTRLLESTDDSIHVQLPSQLLTHFSKWKVQLQKSMHSKATYQILHLRKFNLEDDTIFWDDFLGNADRSIQFEDRIFSSSMALNALLNTWTRPIDNGTHLEFEPNTPEGIQLHIDRAAKYLLSSEADHLPQENAFFSASVKSSATLPMFTVTNYRKSLDGTQSIECNEPLTGRAFGFTFGVQGIMGEEEYTQRESAGCFNMTTQNPDVDYNCDACTFPYWSAPSYTHASRLLALASVQALK